MSTAREPCPNCQLPFYADRNENCPYCGSTPSTPETAPAGSVRRGTPPHRERATCQDCGLDHYADVADCPYCTTAAEHEPPGEDEVSAGADPDADEDGPESGVASVDTTPAGSVRRETPPSRPRTTCAQCGLGHYADDDEGCPYCSTAASHRSTEESTGTAEPSAGTEPEPAGPTASSGESADRTARQSGNSGGLLSRILGIFGR